MKSVKSAGAKSAKQRGKKRPAREQLEVIEHFSPPERRIFLKRGRQREEIGLAPALVWIIGKYVPRTFQDDLLSLVNG